MNTSVRALIVGALYDFAASLTVRKDPITAGASHNASPMAEAVSSFVKERACDTVQDPPVREWRERLGLAEAEADIREACHTPMSFREDLQRIINRWGKDNEYGIPDFILAEYIEALLDENGKMRAKVDGWNANDAAKLNATYGEPVTVVHASRILDVDLSDSKCKSELRHPVTVTVHGAKAIAEQMQKAAAEGVRTSWNRDPRKR
jgi:hypothetical protein